MKQTIDMKLMRYLNLFEKITKIRTNYCFDYNNVLIFIVPANFVSRAIGEKGKNVKKLASLLRKKIKIIAFPEDETKIEKFIISIVEPAAFSSIEIGGEEVIISANRQNKAILIGRNKARFNELDRILREVLNKKLKII